MSVSPLSTPRVVPGDADDDHVVAAALAAHADLVVSGDRHLLAMQKYQGISIVSAAEAVQRIERDAVSFQAAALKNQSA